MEREYILQCEDSLDGIMTGIYEACRKKYPPGQTVLLTGQEENYRLFAQYETVETDAVKAEKVIRTLRRRFGEDVYMDMCMALASQDGRKAEAVYRTVAQGLAMSRPDQVMGNLGDACVHKVFELSRNVSNEIHHLKGFLRFQELDNQILLAQIGPKNDITEFLAPHFADRLPGENFAIYDVGRKLMALHPAGREWYLVRGVDRPEGAAFSAEEEEYQELFYYFCHKIAIKERKNEKLQTQMLPLRFQKYMSEFDKMPKKSEV